MNIETKNKLLTISTIGSVAALAVMTYLHLSSTPSSSSSVGFQSEGTEVSLTSEEVKALYEFNADLNLDDQELLDSMVENSKIMDPNAGEWIPDNYARSKHAHFTEWNTQWGNLRQEIKPRSFAFGRIIIADLMKKIDSVNTALGGAPDLEKIQGIRIYLTFTRFEDRKKRYMDLMIVPVRGNGKDYVELEQSVQTKTSDPNKLVVNTSSPCPDNCP